VISEDALRLDEPQPAKPAPDQAVAISFVIPVRNDAVRLTRCLKSIAANRFPRTAIEVIVIDNASTDDTAAAARAYADTVITLQGHSVAALRNAGARQSRGAIVAFVDADHEIPEDWVSAAVTTLADPRIAAAGFPTDTQPDANWVQRLYDSMRQRPASREEVSWLGSGNLAIKRERFDAVGGFNETLVACEDVDLCNRLAAAGAVIVADPRMRSIHYGDPASIRAMFFGELWRGRDNLRVTFGGPWTLRHLRSALIPLLDLILVAASLAAWLLGYPRIAALCWVPPLATMIARAIVLYRRRAARGARAAAEALLVAGVFDVAKSLALIVRGSHRARRAS
jgi:GT2 family glycosyltransferase